MDLTSLVDKVSPGSWVSINRWDEDGSDLWDLSSPSACQSTMDVTCVFKDGATKPTGQQIFDAIPVLQQELDDAAAYKQTEDYQDDVTEQEFDVSNVDRIMIKVLFSHENRIRTQVEGKSAITMRKFIRRIRNL